MAKHIHLVLDLNTGDITGLALPVDASVPGSSTGAVLGWGCSSLTSTTTTRFLYPWDENSLAENTEFFIDVPRDGTIKNLYVRHNDPAGNGNPIVYTVRKNGVDTSLLVSLLSTSSVGSDLVNTFSVVKGDRISLKATKAASIGSSPKNIVATADLE